MKLLKMCLAVAAVATLAGVAYVYQVTEAAGTRMTDAGDKFVAALTADQKKKAVYDFDDKERVNWHFIPLQDKEKKSTRKGLPLEEMTKEQRATALDLVRAGTSAVGYKEATTIMSLEAILADLEKNGAMVRKPDWYFFTVFGKPSKTGKWGWRVEGHHLSLNFVIDKGAVVSSTPCFFGANPATVKDGDKKGQRTLAESEDLGLELIKSLDDEQKKVALQKAHFPEPGAQTTTPKLGDPVGVPGAKMTEKQQKLLLKLIQSYASRLPADVAEVELKNATEGGVGKVYFAFSGTPEPGKEHTYRVHGPAFVIEYLNVQKDSAGNPANHIHSVWRNTKGDFGLAAK